MIATDLRLMAQSSISVLHPHQGKGTQGKRKLTARRLNSDFFVWLGDQNCDIQSLKALEQQVPKLDPSGAAATGRAAEQEGASWKNSHRPLTKQLLGCRA